MKRLVGLLILCGAVGNASPLSLVDPALQSFKAELSGPRMLDDAVVRYSRELPPQELRFIEKRKGRVQRALTNNRLLL